MPGCFFLFISGLNFAKHANLLLQAAFHNLKHFRLNYVPWTLTHFSINFKVSKSHIIWADLLCVIGSPDPATPDIPICQAKSINTNNDKLDH